MSFRFALGRAQVKHFKIALQTLIKLGVELLVEAVPEQLVLRSINTAKSAFLSVTYFSRFFDSYEIYDTTVVQTVVLSKNALAIFRSQRIAHIEFVLDNAAAKLQATVHTDEGLIKRYEFNCLDGEVLQATVDRDAYPTVVVAEAAELDKLLSSFQHTLDEITLIANPLSTAAVANGHRACEIRSFVDPLKGVQESALLTSLTLDTRSVFTSYSHSSPLAADVTFNIKDFRAMASLCTALGADVALRMETAGAPLVVEPHFRGLREGSDVDFQAMLVLSTLTESQLGLEQQPQQEQAQEEQAQQQADGQQQHWPPPEPADLPSPYEGVDREVGGDGGGAAEAPDDRAAQVSPQGGVGEGGAGRGRRRLPQRRVAAGATAAVATGSATGAGATHERYAAAAAAEGLLLAGGAGPSEDLCGGTGAANHAAAAAVPAGSAGGLTADAPLMQPRWSSHQQYGEGQQPQPDQNRIMGPWGSGGVAAGQPPPQEQYLQFPRELGSALPAFPGGPDPSRDGDTDSQDPEGLPGMRSPYGRQGQAMGQVRSPSLASVADPRVARGGHPQDQPSPGPAPGRPAAWGSGARGMATEASAAAGLGAGPQHYPPQPTAPYRHPPAANQQQQQPGPSGQGAAARLEAPLPPQAVIAHAELFGDDDDDDGDEEELPATPPDQQDTRSMGAGVLGVGMPRGTTDQAG